MFKIAHNKKLVLMRFSLVQTTSVIKLIENQKYIGFSIQNYKVDVFIR